MTAGGGRTIFVLSELGAKMAEPAVASSVFVPVEVTLTADGRFHLAGLPDDHTLSLDQCRDLHRSATEAIVAFAVATGRRDL